MRKLFFDIETIPAGDDRLPVLQKLYEKSEAKRVEKASFRAKPLTFEEYRDKTGTNGAFGRIVCLAYAIDDEPVGCLTGDERDILAKFWDMAKTTELFIGHNIIEFDLKFIYQRSIVLKVKPTKDLSFARYRHDVIFDTMCEWGKWGKNGDSLDVLAHALGIPSSKEDLDGSKVWPYYQEGKIDEICEYCKRDVAVNREVYKRMVFEGELEPKQAVPPAVVERSEDEPF